MTNTARTIRVVIDASQAQAGAANVNAALRSIGNSATGATGSMNAANMSMVNMARGTGALNNGLNAANTNIRRGNNSILNMAKSLGGATLALGGLTAMAGGITGLAIALTGAADKASQIDARLRIATRSTQEYAAASATVRQIANDSRSDLSAITQLYTKMTANAGMLGITTTQAGVATRTFSMALKVGGSSAAEAASSILQLGQAMASGVLAGDEFKSLAENSPVFMGILAESMNVPRGALKALGAEGKITGEQIARALTDPTIVAKMEEQFGKIPVTFGDVKTGISNAMIDIAGALAKGLGIESSLAVMMANIQAFATNSIPFFTNLGAQIRGVFAAIAPVVKGVFAAVGPVLGLILNNMASVVKIALAVGAAFVVMKASMGLQAVIAQVIGLSTAMVGSGGASAFFSGAMNMARNAVNGFTLALLANPLTALAVVLTAGIALLIQFSDKIKLPGQEFGRLNDIVAVVFGDIMRLIGSIISGIVAFGGTVSKVFQAVRAIAGAVFGAIGQIAGSVFNFLNGLTGGFLGKVIGSLDSIMNGFSTAFSFISSIWSNLPAVIGAVIQGTANAVIGGIESMVNRAIGGLNQLINLANRIPKVNIGTIGEVSLGRVDLAGYGASVRGRSENRGRGRVPSAASSAPGVNAPDMGGAAAAASPAAGGDAAKSAADIAKSMADFWTNLEAARDAAGLLGFELARHNAILELSKAAGRDLTDSEKERIDLLLTETATRSAIGDLNQSNVELARQGALLQQEGVLLQTMTAEKAKEEMDIRRAMDDRRSALLIEHADMTDAALASALEQHEARLRENAAITTGNRLLTDRANGADIISRYNRDADPAGAAAADRARRDARINLEAGTRPGGMSEQEWTRQVNIALTGSAREFEESMNKISQSFTDQMTGAITQIGDQIGGEWGAAINKVGRAIDAMAAMARGDNSKGGIFGAIADLFGGPKNNPNAFGKGFTEGAGAFTPESLSRALADPIGSLREGITNIFKPQGSFASVMGKMMGGAAGGLQIGSAIGGLGKMISSKFSEGGSQIGGMIGGMIPGLGPIGGILGSLAGGVLGGIFGGKKVSSGKAGISLDPLTGTLQVSSSGKHGGEADAAAMADKVVSGITSIASRLGVQLGGNPIVAVGKNGGDFRVSPTGGGVTGKEGVNFKTEAEAIAFAIKDLIKDGILVGLSGFSERILRNAKNLDAAVSLAEQYEKLLKGLAELKDPMGSSIKSLTDNLDRMVKLMKANSATTEELANVEEFRRLKLDSILKDQLSKLTDFQRDLMGEGGGVTAMNRLTAAQEEFARLQATVLGGGVVDQDEFTRIGQDIFSLARDIFGTSSSQFQAIRAALIEATNGAVQNVTSAFDDATVVAIDRAADTANQNATVTNDLLRQIAGELRGNGVDRGVLGDDSRAVNGRFDYARV